MNKLEMEYRPFICTIIFCLTLCIRFRKELHMLSLRQELLTSARDFLVIAVCTYNFDLNYKHGNFFQLLKVIFNILYTKFCLDFLFQAISTFFVLLQSEAGSTNKQGKTKSCKTLKARGGIFVSEIDKCIVSFFFDDKGLKLSLLN